ncbi:MAG TPA: molybdopterin cofactor-binding domain-containing protein, partial [Verrucomicrobiae bacterium]|nr:molybdopterin cofactor-binding domain-containing protein [Verrucomicrobiae bacterium]
MKTNDYLELNFKDIKDISDFFPQTRRDFIKRLGGGIIIFVALGDYLSAQEEVRYRGRRGGIPSDFNAFLRIGEDGRVTGYTGKIEMGQGPITSLPQMLAEELDTPLDTVDLVMGDTELCPWDMGTFGSMTTRIFGPAFRAAGAEARAVLLELAADSLRVPQSQLAAKDGVIFDRKDKAKKVTYGQLAKGQKIERHLKVKPPLKEVSEFTIMGKPQLHRDAHGKVTGEAQYAGDIRRPGMLYAKLVRPPAHGATLKSVDTSAAEKILGVQIVRDDDLIAVLHELPDMADDAVEKVKAEYDVPESNLDDKNIFDHLLKVAPGAHVVTEGGDLEKGKKNSAKTFETTYLNSYVAHSPMETHTALADIEGDKITVWASTQNPFGAQGEIARAIGFRPENVRVI